MPIVYDPTGISGYGWGYSTPADSWAGVLLRHPSTELNNGYLTEVDLGFKSDGNSYTLYVYESFDGFTPGTLFETSGNAATSGWHSVAIDSIMMVPGSDFFVAYKVSQSGVCH